MSDEAKRRAWADFWLHEQDPAAGGCLAGAGDELGAAQQAAWRQFAAGLPKKARVLDLATGDGIVLKHLRGTRPDLRLTGVDSAASLPKASPGTKLMAGVAIESLPFQAASFDAVTSQFGYEYGRTGEAAGEVARILKPGGAFFFLVHDRSGPVVAHNRGRAEALRWAALDSGLIASARAVASARRALPLPTPPIFQGAVGEAMRRFPGQSVAPEVTQAILQSLSPAFAPEDTARFIDQIDRKARSELARLEALADAARDQAGANELVAELRDAGLEVAPPEPMRNRRGESFAWEIRGRRAG